MPAVRRGPGSSRDDGRSFRRPCACPSPTSTMVPTIERTIWWQKDEASISKRSSPSPASTQRTSADDANQRDARPGRPAAERGEVVLPVATGRRPVAWPSGRGALATCQAVPAVKRVRRSGWFSTVYRYRRLVAAPPGVEGGGGHFGGPDHDSRPQSPVQGSLKGDRVDVRPGVEGHDLTPGVDAGVGAPGAGDLHRVAEDTVRARPPGRRPPCAPRAATRSRGSLRRRRQPAALSAWSARPVTAAGGFGSRFFAEKGQPGRAPGRRLIRTRCAPLGRCRRGAGRA